MAIYKSYTDNDEMSKSMAMKKVLGWTDTEVKQNYMDLVYDKQWAAVADMMGERISEENPPVDIKSPMRLKKDVEADEKAFSGNSTNAEEGGKNAEESGEGGEMPPSPGGSEEPANEELPPPENEAPTFGLG